MQLLSTLFLPSIGLAINAAEYKILVYTKCIVMVPDVK